MANVVPLFKAGDQTDPSNYRPISILPVVGKLCEKIVCLQLASYLGENHILCPQQHGFRPGHSTETAMLDAINYVTSNLDTGLITTILTADTSKAFDSVEHGRLLEKMGWYGICEHWFRDWLSGRSQSIQGSSTLPVTHGVVQGSLLGPKLFLIFTNDLPSYLPHGKQVMYADDVQFLDCDTPANLSALKQRIDQTMSVALDWFTQNRLKINPNKTDLLLVRSSRRVLHHQFSARFGDVDIKPSDHAKIIGLFLDSNMTWEKQVSQVTRRCFNILVGLSKLRHKIPRETKQLLVKSLVFPHIQYCLTVWGSCNVTQKKRVQKIINFAARIITGFKRNQHISPALRELGWLRVDGMIAERDVAMLSRLLCSTATPPALTAGIQKRSDVSLRTTRASEAGALHAPRVRTEAAKRAFAYRSVMAWNRLPADVRTSESVITIRTAAKKWLFESEDCD